MTIQQAAQEAIDVQDACNLSGVVHSFSRIIKEALWEEARKQGKGTEWVNQHPIAKMFAEKIAQLSRMDEFGDAYDDCKKLSEDAAA